MQNQPFDQQLKILLIGNSGAGKSCLIMRYVDNKFALNFHSTIGVDYKIKIIDINQMKVRLQIWDTAGQDRFKNITSSYYRGADGILILFDITDSCSYEGVQDWLSELQKYIDDKVTKILVGNKCDLSERRQIPASQANAYAKKLGIPYIETSARSGANVDEAFNEMARKVISSKGFEHKLTQSPKKLKSQMKKSLQKQGCC